MPINFWDASGLENRYSSKSGSETVDPIFQAVPHSDMQVTLNPETQTTQDIAARLTGETT